jgi:hypothetical protein
MSQFTNHGERKLVDFLRGVGLDASGIAASWYLALGRLDVDTNGIVIPDSDFTEITGTGYAREEYARTLANWSGTQGSGSTLASSGTSHATSNNVAVDYGTSGSVWGEATHVGFFDASTGGNCWMTAELSDPMDIGNGEPVSIPIGGIELTLGLSGGLSDYAANKMIDLIFRGQAFSWPATMYFGYTTDLPTNAGAGTEPNTGGYARAAVLSNGTYWSAAGEPGDTGASDTGTNGRTSNNVTIAWPAPTASQGDVGWVTVRDAVTLGNLLFWRPIQGVKTVAAGSDAPAIAPDKFGITFR